MLGIAKCILLVCMSVCVYHVSGVTVVEGFFGGSVVLTCTLTTNGDLTWKRGTNLILIKTASGGVIIPEGLYKGDVSLVNGAGLRISPVRRYRDEDKIVECEYSGGGIQQIQLRLLARITGVSISEAINEEVTVTAGVSKTLTCSVTGDPIPPPSYSWSVDGVTASGHTLSSFTFTPDISMRTIKCTAANRYSNGSMLSVNETTATTNFQYLDAPVSPSPIIALEGHAAILRCIAEGNPPPSYEWRKSGRSEVRSTSADYTIVNVHRSAAGTYTCTVNNIVASHQGTVELIVEYTPNVVATFNKETSTLTCVTDGGTGNFTVDGWQHRLDNKLLSASSSKSSILKLPATLSFEDSGYYVCQVSNERNISLRGQVLVTPQTAAIFQRQSETWLVHLGRTETIALPFYTYSDTPNVKVAWRKAGAITLLTSHREETGPVRLVIHGQSVSIEGTVTVLTLRDVAQSDEGNYTVTVTNDFGGLPSSNQITFFVKVQFDKEGAV